MNDNVMTGIRGTVPAYTLAAAAFLAVATLLGIGMTTPEYEARLHIEPTEQSVLVGEQFVVRIMVDATVPVNVFAGELHFDPERLSIAAIDYNISVADLWAERPWYSNGEGIMTFGGGTTQDGGFVGNDQLITITFNARGDGEGSIRLTNGRILLHDGLGTDAQLGETKDAIFFADTPEPVTVATQTADNTQYRVSKRPPTTDLNGDGKQSLADVSIFMLNLTSDDPRFDFNLDGDVNLKDFSVLVGQ